MSMISRQDYPGELLREVVIVDDSPTELRQSGETVTAAAAVNGPNYIYAALSVPESIGAKRNRAARLCTGDIVLHWDDDDIYG